MKFLNNMAKEMTTKVFPCSRCGQKLRLPIKPGKTLRSTCPACQLEVDVEFKSAPVNYLIIFAILLALPIAVAIYFVIK